MGIKFKTEDYIEKVGTDYIKNDMLKEETKVRKYTKNKIPLGTVKKSGRVYNLDLSKPTRILLIGMTRSGKTFFMRGMADRMKKAGYEMSFLPDVKDEFKSSNEPLQSKFQKYLLDGEHPSSMNVVTLRPTFFKKVNPKLPRGNTWYSPKFSDMTQADWMSLFDESELSPVQSHVLEETFDKLSEKNLDSLKVNEIMRVLDSFTEQSQRTVESLKYNYVKKLGNVELFNENHTMDVGKLIKQGAVISLNLQGFETFSDNFNYDKAIYNMILKKIINLRRESEIPEVFIHVDEASRVIPPDKMPATKQTLSQSVELDTAHGVNYTFAVQSLSAFPERIFNNCRYHFVPYSADTQSFKKCLYKAGCITNIQNSSNEAIKVKRRMDRFDWCIVDNQRSKFDIVKPAAPLSKHMEGD